MKTGVIIGRFQVPDLHAGHMHLIKEVQKECDKVIILLGVPVLRDERNPLSFTIRKQMLQREFPDLQIYPLMDRESDEEWSNKIDRLFSGDDDEVILYGSRDCFKGSYTGKLPFKEVSELEGYSGTEVRKKLEHVNNSDFRKGIIFANRKTYTRL